MPHFMRFSSDVKIFSGGNPKSTNAGSVYLVMMGGPQTTATALSGEGATSFTTSGTYPTW